VTKQTQGKKAMRDAAEKRPIAFMGGGKSERCAPPLGRILASTSRVPLGDQAPIAETQLGNSTQQVLESAPRLAIIVPYFQREAGILCRCLASIFAQKVNPKMGLHIIIVDDTSPWPAREELRAIQIPEQMAVAVIMRNNGGPGAARNTGLDHVPLGTDFIAFIDSDDTWREDHVQRAIDALGNSNDLYFADHLQWGGFSYFDTKEFGAFVKVGQSSTALALTKVNEVIVCSSAVIIPYAVREFIAHTSTIVYRAGSLSKCRFIGELRWGEDDIFLLDLLFASTQACISTEIEVELGFGENIFLGSWSWDDDNNLKRFHDQFIAQKEIRRRYQLSPELYEIVTQRIRSWRPALTFFIVRQLLKGKGLSVELLLSLLRQDPLFFPVFPLNVIRAAVEWAFGKLQGNPAFSGGRICR
jgi:succinoglycan biosynthesis protein ExoW